ncbi:hypothetical protein [Mycobacterium sp. 236(2023)]|uniref:hypothetical protein n=1 Tax=Mycobacterium sp. 236(2023) TaxID=3038163 RepID=UPI0024154D0D|nr:hypothetical protein [Mycobacterium sp. 236(2023)]MDG4669142.1 hypothetical protein [Mycobacterium sp. 236(2023)]
MSNAIPADTPMPGGQTRRPRFVVAVADPRHPVAHLAYRVGGCGCGEPGHHQTTQHRGAAHAGYERAER